MSERLVVSETRQEVAFLTLDSPPNRNALSVRLLEQLLTGLHDQLEDPQVRLVVLGHTGGVFCSGADLREQALAYQASGASPGAGGLVPLLTMMLDSPKPIVCRIDGAVRGGGMGLVAASDVALASTSASFAFSEVRVGVAPAVIATPVLAKISRAAALELFLSGRVFSAAEALAIGLINRTVEPSGLDDAVSSLLVELLQGAPGAQAEAKRLISAVPRLDRQVGFEQMVELSARLFSSAEGQDGIAAFRERRPPSWSH
ncbi:MAG: enoyl-CoA hydratase-related protein [Candidatus Dormibacteria bacterium]